jgi:hypothetical protein
VVVWLVLLGAVGLARAYPLFRRLILARTCKRCVLAKASEQHSGAFAAFCNQRLT